MKNKITFLLAALLATASLTANAASYIMHVPSPGLKPTPSQGSLAYGITITLQSGGYRTWSDGSLAQSCNEYENPSSPHGYAGDTGSGTYRIQPSGAPTQDVYCDMTTQGGGWTVVESVKGGYPASEVWSVTTATSPIVPNSSSSLFLPNAVAIPLAKVSGSVLIYDVAAPSSYVLTSSATMLGNLRAGDVMNYGVTDSTSYFTVSNVTTQFNLSCSNTSGAASAYPSIFWGCGNTNAMDISLYSDGVHGLAGWTSSGGYHFVIMYR